jgi:hypothetical protein
MRQVCLCRFLGTGDFRRSSMCWIILTTQARKFVWRIHRVTCKFKFRDELHIPIVLSPTPPLTKCCVIVSQYELLVRASACRYFHSYLTLLCGYVILWYYHGHLFILSLLVCLTTSPKPLPKRTFHIVRSRATTFRCEYPSLP